MASNIIVMGVSGSGKSTVGAALAARRGWCFVDGDDLHPPANVAKMAAGEPLTDADRTPWLARIAEALQDCRDIPLVIACSALKRRYRDRLRQADSGVRFVFLYGSTTLLAQRLSGRAGHFMPTSLLQSQLDALEAPGPDEADVLPLAISLPLAAQLAAIEHSLQQR